MKLESDKIAALQAVVDAGTFDEAAISLNVTASAVSQRIKALEADVGQVVVTRSKPCVATAVGEVLVRHARQLSMLTAETRRTLADPGSGWTDVPIVVNADSLATWFRPVLTDVASCQDVALRIEVADQEYSAAQLRKGSVLAAVTADPQPVTGCEIYPLGTMAYVAVAGRDLAQRFTYDDRPDLGAMPMVQFNEVDGLQDAVLAAAGVEHRGKTHYVPSCADFRHAVEIGLGWGVLPLVHAEKGLSRGELIRLAEEHHEVALYWQRWRTSTPTLDRVSAFVLRAASEYLKPAETTMNSC